MAKASMPEPVRLTTIGARFAATNVAFSGASAVCTWVSNWFALELLAVDAAVMVIGVAMPPFAVTVNVASAVILPLLGRAALPWIVAVGTIFGARPSS